MSDIWSEFEKIAISQGLISVAEEDEQPKSKARDSLSDDAVRLLYNIEPEDKKSIIEIAHPETAVVGRAYDAMNSVVENEHQRHDMMAYIALKMPNGHLTQRRYVAAKKELLDSLIRSAFTLDHQDEDSLMALADSCAQRLVEREIKKEAVVAAPLATAAPLAIASPLVIAGVAAAILGLGYYFFSGAPPAEDVYQNAQKVVKALEPLSDRSYVGPIFKDMNTLIAMAKQVYAVKGQLVPVHSVDESITAAQEENEKKRAETAHQILTNYMTQLIKVKEAINGWVSAIRVMEKEDTEERGDWAAKWHALTRGLSDTPEETLIYSLKGKSDMFSMFRPSEGKKESTHGGLSESIDKELIKFKGAVDIAQQKSVDISNTLASQKPVDERSIPKFDLKQTMNEPEGILTPEKKPSLSDINKELFNTMGIPNS